MSRVTEAFDLAVKRAMAVRQIVVGVRDHRIPRIAVLALSTIAAAIGVYLGAAGARRNRVVARPSSGPIVFGPLSVQLDALEFGTVWAQRDFKWSIPVTNVGTRTVDVTDVISSCGCAVVDTRPFSVAPRQTAEVKLSIDLTSKRRPVDGQAERLFPVGVMLFTKAVDAGEIRLNLRGIVKDPLYLTPPAVVFWDVAEDTEDLPVVQLMAIPLVPLAKLSAKCDDELQVVVGTREYEQSAKGGTSERGFPIEAALKKRLPCGSHVFNMTLFATTAEGQELPGLRVPVKVAVVGDVFISPAFGHLGVVQRGSSEETSFQLISRVRSPFRVTKVAVPTFDDFRVTVDSEAAQPAHRLSVAFSPSERCGERSVPITIDWEKECDVSAAPASARSGTLKLEFTYVSLP